MKPAAPRPWAGSPYRRRRLLWTLALLAAGTVYYLTQYGAPSLLALPPSFKDMGFGGFSPDSSRAGRVAQAKAAVYAGEGAHTRLPEIDAFLHFVVARPERRLVGDGDEGAPIDVEGLGSMVVDPAKPVDLRVYAEGGQSKEEWEERVKRVHGQAPLVVFSKTYCPFSKRAKALLATYDLEPKPFIVELDARSDGAQLQTILARLTGRRTVPNILLKGISMGGSDDVHAMHEDGQRLKRLLEDEGIVVKGI
ncbi:thioredoxin-like protein [Daedaleopsis nitida]|nr:thioredoxin-like protein [Daedaleopsis nitida]